MKKFTLFCFLICSSFLYSQVTIEQTNHDNDIKLSTLPYYSFGKGVKTLVATMVAMELAAS